MLTASSPEALPQQTAPARGLFISGVVRDDDTHDALSAVALELQRISGDTASPPVVSGTRGEFQFNGVVSGDYRITAHQKGYETATLDIMLGGIPLSNVSITLRRSAVAPGSVPGDAISAHQLSIPEKARDDFDKGFKLLNGTKPDYRRALTYFERAIKEYPDYYEAYAETGVAQHRLGDKAAAEQALRKSVELSSGRYPDALMWLAEMLNDASRFSESEEFARRCATENDSSWRCALELARSLAGMKRSTEAEAVATKASELNPNNAGTFLVLGNIHIQEHKYAAVVKDFDTYLKLDPSGPQSEQVRAAEEQARKALNKTQNSAPTPPKQ
ncbi:MAG: tetratricopeptide repeat protein [Acidobacteriia bacterium]|nr:tetratricopeptide repeat protein [Terriglobia bacterium]